MNKIKNALYGTAASAMVLAPALVSAQGWNITNGQAGTNLASRTIGSQLNIILLWLLAIVAVLAVIGFVVAGVLYITAAGDEDQVEKAKKTMMYSIIGLIVALIGYIVVNSIGQIFVTGSGNF
jgi:cytochrome bd-type quinol oxidase subunit 2